MANLKNIPPIDEILAQRPVLEMIEKHNRDFVVRIIRKAVEDTRQELRSSQNDLEREQIMGLVIEKMRQTAAAQSQGSLKRVINGTGVVLHTNLGRAPLGERALHYMSEMARNYNNLEMNLEKGQRGSRYDHVEDLLRELTGAEAALVVNNNAAAVLLGLSTLADQREVIVSRGQLVEIGGAFRIPEVMKLSGARLVEVGTTNKTYISDFAAAINENTALLFAAHTSNYKIIGFTAEVELAELVRLGQEKGIAVMQDLGSGILYRSPSWKLGEEPTVQECLAAGTDIITFSGDKLLGGPQAGIIIGKKVYIEAMKKNQLTRALRVDKLTIAALEGTLLEYLNGKPDQNIPVIRMLEYSLEDLEERAEKLYMTLETRIRTHKYIEKLSLIRLDDMVGGGAYPTYLVPGYGLEIRFKGISLENAAQRLRLMNPAVVVRRQEDAMIISVRTLLEKEIELVAELLCQALED